MWATESRSQLIRTVGDLGAVVQEVRRARQWTQAELAARAGVSRRWVVALEAGQSARVELGRVLAVLSALDLQIRLDSSVGGRGDVSDGPAAATVMPDGSPIVVGVARHRFDLGDHLDSFFDDHGGSAEGIP